MEAEQPVTTADKSVGEEPKTRSNLFAGQLGAIFVAICVLAAAVVSVSVVVFVRTSPAEVPTGPSRTVLVTATIDGAYGTAELSSVSGVESTQLSPMYPTKNWSKDVAFGETVTVRLVLTQQADSESGTALMSCTITSGGDTEGLATASTNFINGTAACTWTNDGKS